MASCSTALVENFSTSRSRSTGFGVEEELGREGGLSSGFALPFCFSSGISLTRYMRRLPVLKPTSNRSPITPSGLVRSPVKKHTICKDGFNLELVPLPELNNRPSCEGGKHGYRAPASIQVVPELKVGIIEYLDSSKRVFGACEACCVHRRIMLLYNGAQVLALPEMTMFAETLVWTALSRIWTSPKSTSVFGPEQSLL